MWIKACLNGGRRREEHPGVPVTPDEVAAAAAAAAEAGAVAVHVHQRDAAGHQSLSGGDVGAVVAAVRRARPGLPVGVTTGLWISAGDVGRRLAEVTRWADLPEAERPDFASANVSEPGFADLVAALRAAGIGVEPGVWSIADAEALADAFPNAQPWLRILVEVPDGPVETATADADAILARLDDLAVPGPRLLHGDEARCWPLVAHAGRLGLATRIGLEDVLVGPDGEPVTGNADLVRRAAAMAT